MCGWVSERLNKVASLYACYYSQILQQSTGNFFVKLSETFFPSVWEEKIIKEKKIETFVVKGTLEQQENTPVVPLSYIPE